MSKHTKLSSFAAVLAGLCLMVGPSVASANSVSEIFARVQVLKTRVQNEEVKVRLSTEYPVIGTLRLTVTGTSAYIPVSPAVAFATQGDMRAITEKVPIGPRTQKLLLSNTHVSGPCVGYGLAPCGTFNGLPNSGNDSKVELSISGVNGGGGLFFLWGGKNITPFSAPIFFSF